MSINIKTKQNKIQRRRAEGGILVSDKLDCKSKTVERKTERLFKDSRPVHQEDITIANIFAPHITVPNI